LNGQNPLKDLSLLEAVLADIVAIDLISSARLTKPSVKKPTDQIGL
jgi:hypothetical protein